ncbi:hypothetical protein AAFF_G00159230 [Aldrovandia affinis]|uniref:Uncharacterized protein n=1 Tax=Aldrovandia affinis TaxID=143900 RepID=A0AAD7RN14_9TELE|nr:hypothetical protein AAFF_G00159230 [Aldrovandia affinis]
MLSCSGRQLVTESDRKKEKPVGIWKAGAQRAQRGRRDADVAEPSPGIMRRQARRVINPPVLPARRELMLLERAAVRPALSRTALRGSTAWHRRKARAPSRTS